MFIFYSIWTEPDRNGSASEVFLLPPWSLPSLLQYLSFHLKKQNYISIVVNVTFKNSGSCKSDVCWDPGTIALGEVRAAPFSSGGVNYFTSGQRTQAISWMLLCISRISIYCAWHLIWGSQVNGALVCRRCPLFSLTPIWPPNCK